MKKITIQTVDAAEQRYPTAGDYFEDDRSVKITITDQISDDYEFLVAIHELIEFWITKKRGIKEEDITQYDMDWERSHEARADEPGNEEDCIYKHEHRFAENIERQIAHEIGIDWETYNNSLKI